MKNAKQLIHENEQLQEKFLEYCRTIQAFRKCIRRGSTEILEALETARRDTHTQILMDLGCGCPQERAVNACKNCPPEGCLKVQLAMLTEETMEGV
jgi:hypothetical protein